MQSIHIRVPPLIIERIDRWAESHCVDRSTAIRSLVTHGLDAVGLVETIENAIFKKEITIPKSQIADLGTSLAYALLMSLGRSPDEMSPILRAVRDALQQL